MIICFTMMFVWIMILDDSIWLYLILYMLGEVCIAHFQLVSWDDTIKLLTLEPAAIFFSWSWQKRSFLIAMDVVTFFPAWCWSSVSHLGRIQTVLRCAKTGIQKLYNKHPWIPYDPIISLTLFFAARKFPSIDRCSAFFVTWFYAGECPIFHPTFQPFDLDPLARIGPDHHSRSSKGTVFFCGTDIWWMMVGTRKILSEQFEEITKWNRVSYREIIKHLFQVPLVQRIGGWSERSQVFHC